ncbi:hypothetical protein CD33_01300 [Ureibacillus sinduriensis BLB-1 = JCM 15800]|uniref:Uncharacterized protein n=1 Tax=Ureibacillus sinduriensis BLB-1 = JCM 15800 TaxID=1384057 RepID=A0A0A3I139_9BACL|nr:hypothetical protein CD33_01300 [Ureibacillus sinduriensis BLB-1 = JCM 15800]
MKIVAETVFPRYGTKAECSVTNLGGTAGVANISRPFLRKGAGFFIFLNISSTSANCPLVK